jgi:hypothetical protein
MTRDTVALETPASLAMSRMSIGDPFSVALKLPARTVIPVELNAGINTIQF